MHLRFLPTQARTFQLGQKEISLQIQGLRTWKVFGLVKAAEGTEATFVIPSIGTGLGTWCNQHMLGKSNLNTELVT